MDLLACMLVVPVVKCVLSMCGTSMALSSMLSQIMEDEKHSCSSFPNPLLKPGMPGSVLDAGDRRV